MANTPTLSVNLAAIRANYNLLKTRHANQNCAAVVKANAYGLGAEAVSKTLYAEGCRKFFVATLAEAVELRAYLPDAEIAVFNGLFAGQEKEFLHHKLTPVLNDLGQIELFSKSLATKEKWRAFIHIDTGMTRLGLSQSDIKKMAYPEAGISYVMSHLSSASEPTHYKNAEQLARFNEAITYFPGAKKSLVNSAGLFLGPEFHFDLARPGCALYGINSIPGDNPMQHVATLSAPILQIRTLDRDEDVGYGATYPAKKNSRIAIIGMGYADGYFRSQSNKGFAYISGMQAPIAGRVSMDMIALDISDIPHSEINESTRAEFINEKITVNDLAEQCQTIGYEIFTRIGNRVKRIYS